LKILLKLKNQIRSNEIIFFMSLSCFLFASDVSATGPRITKSLLSPNENQIYSYDYPPFTTTDLEMGGMSTEIIDAVLQKINIDATQIIVPLQSMVKFYIHQEQPLAVYGKNLNFNQQQKKHLTFIPIGIMNSQYVFYKPAHKENVSWNGQLSSLAKYTYGASNGELVEEYKKENVKVKYARTHSLLKKLISKEIDFMKMSELNRIWMLDKHFPHEKSGFVVMNNSDKIEPVFIIFNKKHPQSSHIAKIFKKGLAEIVDSGEYLKIIKKYRTQKSKQEQHMQVLSKLLTQVH